MYCCCGLGGGASGGDWEDPSPVVAMEEVSSCPGAGCCVGGGGCMG